MIIWWNSLVVFVSCNFSAPSVFSQSQTVKTWSVLSSMHANDLPPSEKKWLASKLESINGNLVLNLTGFGKWKSDYLSLKCMLDNHKCFQCIIIPDSNMRWLTLSACSTSNLATCDQKSIWIWVECQAKNNGINSFPRWSFVLYVMNWYSRHFLNYKLWILSIWIFEFPSS